LTLLLVLFVYSTIYFITSAESSELSHQILRTG